MELFISKQLVHYPSDQEVMKKYQILNINELCIIQEIDQLDNDDISLDN